MKKVLHEIRQTLGLAVPMIIGQVAIHSLHLIDTAMIGRVGVTEVAAAAYTGSLFGVPLLFGFGLATALSILVAQAFGAGNLKESRIILRHGILINTVYGLLCLGFALLIRDWILPRLGQPEPVVEAAKPYFSILMGTLPLVLVFQVMKNFCEAQNRPWLPLLWLIAAAILNVFLNWLLIFGNWGFPEMGLVGAGWATLLARLVAIAALFLHLRMGTSLLESGLLAGRPLWKRRITGDYLGIGLPIGLQISLEAFIFNFAAILMGWIGTVTLAAHHIALNLAALTFMLPLGLSFAVGIRVGQAAGGGNYERARLAGLANCGLAAVFMGVMAVLFLVFRHTLPTFFLGEDVEQAGAVASLAAQFLVVAALFQIGDGVQVVAIGALRGLKDVRVPTALVFFSFWVISIPVGIYLAFDVGGGSRALGLDWSFLGEGRLGMGWGGIGIWIGMAFGLCVNALILTLRFLLVSDGQKEPG